MVVLVRWLYQVDVLCDEEKMNFVCGASYAIAANWQNERWNLAVLSYSW